MSAAALEAIIILAAKYGPEVVTGIIALFKKQTVTIDDVEKLFANVKPFEAYNVKPPQD